MGALYQLHMNSQMDADAAAEQEPKSLIRAAAGGDLGAFERLYRRYSPQIYGLCLRLAGVPQTAEDCTQECFVDAWRSLSRFEGRSAFATWLHSIAVRAVCSKHRGLRFRHEVPEPDDGLPEVADAGAESPLDVERAVA